MSATAGKQSTTIALRLPSTKRALIDRAARQAGESRSEFMIRASVDRAHSILGDRTRIELNTKQWSAFLDALDAPLPKAAALAKLLGHATPWDK